MTRGRSPQFILGGTETTMSADPISREVFDKPTYFSRREPIGPMPIEPEIDALGTSAETTSAAERADEFRKSQAGKIIRIYRECKV
jgi:phosphopantetheine adenylyltransferase